MSYFFFIYACNITKKIRNSGGLFGQKHKKPLLMGKKEGKNNIKIMKKIRIWFSQCFSIEKRCKDKHYFHSRHNFLRFF